MTTASDDVRSALDADGFVVLDALLDPATLAGVRAAVDAALARDGVRGPSGTLHVDDLAGPAVEALWSAPRLVAAVRHVLGPDAERRAMGLRAPNPGFGAQALHADFAGPPPPDGAHVAVAIVALVDITADGGATRVVPGTHTWNRVAPGDTVDRPYPGERHVALAAGSAALLNGHLWHSGTRNGSSHRRDALQVTFGRPGTAQGPM
ncbi:phytanoyl-CoA dioxygenase family protein [Pseudonocardia sp. GCM10023141]|uniref:phytanoyl-CoA dioxygenase family protein n=1 Tax=Pseudonocardia sp. GCM10023141 TaxID=3252653 RepID=UPI003616F064